ncbi:hypothetical protein C8T65DRAFT_760370 [Cerioporus squamosus]|nr:hypothetical protein C8T65DRAFT_760370 [Cerioporus squamosus]
MSMSFLRVPTELVQGILAFALNDNPCPGDILCVNRTFFELGQPLLHGRLHFYSINQLSLFANGSAPLACAPRSVTISLAGGSADFEVFRHLMGALKRCQHSRSIASGEAQESTADIQSGTPRLHKCRWTRCHCACIRTAAIRTWVTFTRPYRSQTPRHSSGRTRPRASFLNRNRSHRYIPPYLRGFHLDSDRAHHAHEHVLPLDELGVNTPFSRDAPLLPLLPSLRTLYIGQATLLPPSSVAAMLARPGQDALECVRLVDTYRHSIWGDRIRLRDVETRWGS